MSSEVERYSTRGVSRPRHQHLRLISVFCELVDSQRAPYYQLFLCSVIGPSCFMTNMSACH